VATPIITLTTDWGISDFYLGALKGRLLSLAPQASLIDISHSIALGNQIQAGFVVRNCWSRFPKGTVHLVAVPGRDLDPGNLIALQSEGHYFLGPDDGLFSLVFDQMPNESYYVMNDKGATVRVNSDMLSASAAYLSGGGDLSKMGSKVDQHKTLTMLKPTVDEYSIRGSVIYVDGTGNLITNISRELIMETAKGRTFEIILRKNQYTIYGISESYQEVVEGDLVALINESGFVELSLRNANAMNLLGISFGEIIMVDFK
jgi:S-adenosylmethionine hydrolase